MGKLPMKLKIVINFSNMEGFKIQGLPNKISLFEVKAFKINSTFECAVNSL